MMTIGKLAALADVSADSLRFHERQGLIAPTSKSGAGYRLYDARAVQRLRFIAHAKKCGFTKAFAASSSRTSWRLCGLRNRFKSSMWPSACCKP